MTNDFISMLEIATQDYQFPEKKLLAVDVGCGDLPFSELIYEFLANHGPVGYLIGVDLNPESNPIITEKERSQGVRLFLGDARQLRRVLDSRGVHEKAEFIISIHPWGLKPDILGLPGWDEKNMKEIYASCREVISPEGIIVVLPDMVVTSTGKVEVIEELLSEADFEVVVNQKTPSELEAVSLAYPYIMSAKPI